MKNDTLYSFTTIDRTTPIEDLIDSYPDAVATLMKNGIRCLACGEPIWGTLGDAMEEKQFSPEKQEELIRELRTYLQKEY